MSTELARKRVGNLRVTDRNFGLEIECLAPVSRGRVAEALSEAGVDACRESYNHVTVPYWKVITDASVVNMHYGDDLCTMEIVSPILSGKEGLAEVRKVLRVLNTIGAEVNRSCGLHVHHSVQDMTVREVKKLAELHTAFEEPIGECVSPTRRGRYNEYCRAVLGHQWDSLEHARAEWARSETIEDFSCCWYERQAVINFQNADRRGAVEFRQHDATLDYAEVAYWIAFTQSLVEAASKGVATPDSEQTRIHKLFTLANVQPIVRWHLMEQVKRYENAEPEPYCDGDGYDEDEYDAEDEEYVGAGWYDEDEDIGECVYPDNGIPYFTRCQCQTCRAARGE